MTDSRADDFGPDADGRIVALAEFLRQGQAPAPPPQCRRLVPIFRAEANAAGTTSDLVNARIVGETAAALAGPDGPDAEAISDAVAMLREIGPRDGREALIARRLIAIDALAMETIALARASTEFPLVRAAYAAQAVALSGAAAELDEALERRRVGSQRTVEVKHVVVHSGGQAIVGPVTHIAPKAPSPPR
jgi:hypothetical protein